MKNYLTVAITTFLSFFSFSQENGLELFDESYVHEIRITFEQEDFWDSLEYYYEQYLDFGAPKQYMLADVEIDGNYIDSVGVREKGFFSNWGSEGLKEPLKIDLNEYVKGQKYDGLKKINLQNGFSDPSMMRDALAYKFMRDAGIAAPRTSYARVFLNDTYWGLYIVVEQIDDRFLKNWFDNNNGNLFKCMNNTNLDWQGTSKVAYEDEFELKTNEELDEWDKFIELVDKINEGDDFEDSISTILQMNNYTRVLAADILMSNWDSYYEHGRNFYLYYDSTLNVFQWLPWDYNLAFSASEPHIVVEYDGWGVESKPLVEHIMESDFYRPLYFNHLCLMLDNYFSLDHLESWIDDTQMLIEEDLDDDPNKYFTTGQFNTSISSNISVTDDWGFTTVYPGIKPFIEARYSTVMSQLEDEEHTCTMLGVEELEITSVQHLIFPNPSATGVFTIRFAETVEDIKVYSLYGQLVHSQQVTQGSEMPLDLSHLSDGVYIVELLGVNKTQLRVVKQ